MIARKIDSPYTSFNARTHMEQKSCHFFKRSCSRCKTKAVKRQYSFRQDAHNIRACLCLLVATASSFLVEHTEKKKKQTKPTKKTFPFYVQPSFHFNTHTHTHKHNTSITKKISLIGEGWGCCHSMKPRQRLNQAHALLTLLVIMALLCAYKSSHSNKQLQSNFRQNNSNSFCPRTDMFTFEFFAKGTIEHYAIFSYVVAMNWAVQRQSLKVFCRQPL